ncbi:MAG: NAD(P)-binding domain-containing protein, partial [Ktedonobacteraceae bacterium]
MVDVAIVGAGPYGLSVAAHLRRAGVPFRIFGRPMDSWQAHMPKGMMLKSDGFASTIDDPDQQFTLKQFCAERGINYADLGIPVALDTFVAFGLAFKGRMLPELENKLVTGIEQTADGFALTLEDGEKVKARRVILAIGITHFQHVPASLAKLPEKFLSHSFQHSDLECFRGRHVVVIGGGASALE